MMTQMKVRGLMFDPYNNAYIVILRDEDNSDTMLPIWVGKSEASAISFALEGVTPPRPMTHDLMKAVLDTVDAKVLSVVVTDLKDNTYYAKIHLMGEDSEYSIDSRPSDAIALALRTNAPIFAQEEVIRKQASEQLDQWLENLKPEDFGKYES
jgi:bifunctional DNase/RNase